MAKRFTATEKWRDSWFLQLEPAHKLAWLYLLDECDLAGVVDLTPRLAELSLGMSVDWDAFLEAAGSRVTRLDNGKLWLTGFVAFQYGALSRDCRPHIPVFAALEKHGLMERVFKGYPKGINTLQEQDKDKDKDKEKGKEGKGGAGGKPKFTPPSEDEVSAYIAEKGFRFAASEFLDYYGSQGWRKANGQRLTDWRRACGTFERNHDKFGSRGSPPTSRTERVGAAYVARHNQQPPPKQLPNDG